MASQAKQRPPLPVTSAIEHVGRDEQLLCLFIIIIVKMTVHVKISQHIIIINNTNVQLFKSVSTINNSGQP